MKYIFSGIILLLIGGLLITYARYAADKVEAFYSRYPLIRLAPSRHHRVRDHFMRFFGLTFVLIGFYLIFFVGSK